MNESEFEIAIQESPNDAVLLRRYGNWLVEQGDQRGTHLLLEIERRDALACLKKIENQITDPSNRYPIELDWLDRILPNFVHAPMAGTIYLAPTPGADPYVSVNEYCQPDTVVGMIESIKMFNEIPAEHIGVVAEIFVQHESAVKFGQPLFRISRPPRLFSAG